MALDDLNYPMNGLSRRRLLLLALFVLIVFSPCLFNGFVGDDNVLIVHNTFYHSLKNIPRLLDHEYNIRSIDYFVNQDRDKGTGSVAFRPVLSLTYFLDFRLWKLNPFGYHLENLLLHIANTILVYLVVMQIAPACALLAALLFSIHPVQTEAVCAIGYRADLLACFFILTSFYAWLRSRSRPRWNLLYPVSVLAYFLAVFSKESAVVFPLVLLAFRKLLSNPNGKKPFWPGFLGYLGIMAFYLYVYFFVFPNTTLHFPPSQWGFELGHRLRLMLRIWRGYGEALCFPWTVSLLPPLYSPPIGPSINASTLVDLSCFIAFLSVIVLGYRYSRSVCFFSLWFLIFYAPVANFLPNPNPMAFRYLYLPSIGIFFLFAAFWERMARLSRHAPRKETVVKILRAAFLSLYVVCTFFVTFLWKSNYVAALEWIKKYPTHYKGYSVLAREFYRKGLFVTARNYYQKSLRRGSPNPNDVYESAVCSFAENNLDEAERLFKGLIRDYPNYTEALAGLAGVYKVKGDCPKAVKLYQEAARLAPQEIVYYYPWMDCLFNMERTSEAREIFLRARQIFGGTKQKKELEAWFSERIAPHP